MASTIYTLSLLGAIATVVALPQISVVDDAKLPQATVIVNPATVYQDFDGIGMSEAFGHAAVLHGDSGLSAKNATIILDLLFTDAGAALSILRNDITQAVLEPNDPGSPSATPQYSWDYYDAGQLWLSQQAAARGVNTFYADAWSAPSFMKTNNNSISGGYLCGVTGTNCSTGDWRKAYANYLVQYLHNYAKAGVHYDYIGFLNEPEENVTYTSMLSNGQQAADFIEVFGPILKKSGYKTKLACCDNDGWENSRRMVEQMENATGGAAGAYTKWVDLVTSHGYSSPPTTPLPTQGKKVWETEWADLGDQGQQPWYNASAPSYGHAAAGLTWSNNIQRAFTNSNVSAFLGWVANTGSFGSNDALIEVVGDSYLVSPRLWAFAHFSRFVRPGGKRIDATAVDATLGVSAFVNADKSTAVQVINNSDQDKQVTISGLFAPRGVKSINTWLTNNANNMTMIPSTANGDVGFKARVPARSIVSFVVPAHK